MFRTVGKKDYFPTQGAELSLETTITNEDRAYGAPLGPVPRSFLRIPAWLSKCAGPATDEEIAYALKCRAPFAIPGYPDPYMPDIVRAFRLVSRARTYIEIGTFDRGNLAYVSQLLADDALLIGVDIQAESDRDARLRSVLKPSQRYVSVVGDSRAPATIDAALAALDGLPLDCVFIDGGHTAHAVMCDYVNFGERVRPEGLVMFHDSLWEGDARFKGTSEALSEIDRFDPIYLVPGAAPCRRFMRAMWKDEIWGVVGVHRVERNGEGNV